MKIILCPECKNIMEKNRKYYICTNCSKTMTISEYKDYLNFKKRKEERDKQLLFIKKQKALDADSKGELIHPLTYGSSKIKIDPIATLDLIKNLLLSDSITNEEKETLKSVAEIFINNHNCTICNNLYSEFDITGLWNICDLTNKYITNDFDYYVDLPICPKDCPVKKYKL